MELDFILILYFNNYLLSTCCVLGTILDTVDAAAKQINENPCPSEAYIANVGNTK